MIAIHSSPTFALTISAVPPLSPEVQNLHSQIKKIVICKRLRIRDPDCWMFFLKNGLVIRVKHPDITKPTIFHRTYEAKCRCRAPCIKKEQWIAYLEYLEENDLIEIEKEKEA